MAHTNVEFHIKAKSDIITNMRTNDIPPKVLPHDSVLYLADKVNNKYLVFYLPWRETVNTEIWALLHNRGVLHS